MVTQYHFQYDQQGILFPALGPGSNTVLVSIAISYDAVNGTSATVSWAGRVQGFFRYSADGRTIIGYTPTNDNPLVIHSLDNIARNMAIVH